MGSDQATTAGSPEVSSFLFSGSNYNSEQVNSISDRYTAELGRLRTVLDLSMPWDLALSPRMLIMLTGTGSAFDTLYRVESIERRYSTTSGSSQVLRATECNT